MLTRWEKTLLRSGYWLERLTGESRAPAAGGAVLASGQLEVGAIAAGRYRIEALLGEGGMGRVWLVFDTLEKQQVALKELFPAQSTGAAEAGKLDVAFRQEFYTMSKLQHPNTVKVFDFGQLESGSRYLTMEVVEGRDLESLLQEKALPLATVYRVLTEMASVLGYIHSRLYVHCDIKSANARLTKSGAVKLMDFGLMHQLGTPAGGALKGTLAYMAPEIFRGGVIDGRTDLYSLGVLAFELASGRFPFEGKTINELVNKHLNHRPPPLHTLREVPQAFEALVSKLLAKDPKERHQSASEVIKELSAISGRSAEVASYAAQASYLRSAEMVGREGEQAQLMRALEAVQAGKGRSLLLTAPPGVGKSRILQEFQLAAKLSDIQFMVAGFLAEGQAPLAPLAELVEQLANSAPADALKRFGPMLTRICPPLTKHGVVPAPKQAPGAEKVMLFEALEGFLNACAADRPFIWCFEDLHWADASSLELINVMIRGLADTRSMILGTFRSNEVDRFSVHYATVEEGVADRLELATLSPEKTSLLVGSLLGPIGFSDQFLERIYNVTQGNPFFITELLRGLIENKTLYLEAGTWVAAENAAQVLPGSVAEVVNQRVESLTAPVLRLFRRLAPVGRMLDLRVVRPLAGLPDKELFSNLDALVERQFLQRVEGNFYFSHELVRQAIYAETPGEQRQLAHRDIGNILEALGGNKTEKASTLGYHFARGGASAKAIDYFLIAADDSQSRSLLNESMRLVSEAADLLEVTASGEKDRTQLVGLWGRLVDMSSLIHPPTCAKYADKLCPQLEERIDGPRGIARFQEEVASLVARPGLTGRRKLTKIWSEQALQPDSHDAMHLVPKLICYRNAQAFALGAIGQTPRAMEIIGNLLAQSPEPGAFRAAAQISRAVGLFHVGKWKPLHQEALEAHHWFEEHLAKMGTLPRRLMWNYAATFYWPLLAQGGTGQALDSALLAKGRALCAEHGFSDWTFFLMVPETFLAAILGQPEQMQATYGPISDVIRKMGNSSLMQVRVAFLVPIYYLQRAESELALEAINKLDASATRLNDAWMKRYCQLYRAQYAYLFERSNEAVEKEVVAARSAIAGLPSFSRNSQLLGLEALVAVRRNDTSTARELAEKSLALAVAPETANPWDECIARRTLAEVVGNSQEGLALAQQAVEVAQRHGHPLQEALSYLSMAELSVVQKRSQAAHALEQAEAGFHRLKTPYWLEQVRKFRGRAATG